MLSGISVYKGTQGCNQHVPPRVGAGCNPVRPHIDLWDLPIVVCLMAAKLNASKD